MGVLKAGEQDAAGLEHAVALAPDGQDIRHETVGHGMEDKIERAVFKTGEIAHIALHQIDGQAVALRHHGILRQLGWAVVKHGDARAQRGEDRPLLPAGGREAQHALARDGAYPILWHGLSRGENHFIIALPCPLYGFRRHGNGPHVLLAHFVCPRLAVVLDDVHFVSSKML